MIKILSIVLVLFLIFMSGCQKYDTSNGCSKYIGDSDQFSACLKELSMQVAKNKAQMSVCNSSNITACINDMADKLDIFENK